MPESHAHGKRADSHEHSRAKGSDVKKPAGSARAKPAGTAKTTAPARKSSKETVLPAYPEVKISPPSSPDKPEPEVEERREQDEQEREDRSEDITDHVTPARGERKEVTMEPPRVEKREESYKSDLNPENLDIREFNSNMSELRHMLTNPRYQHVDSDFPVDELTTVVSMVSRSIADYRQHTAQSQHQLEEITATMKVIKENVHLSVTREAMNTRAEDEYQSPEEKELRARLTRLNAAIAKASADVTESVRLATETEATAVKAHIAADRARTEARRIEEEVERKRLAETEKREQERLAMEEERRRREEEERRAEEEKRAKEEEWRRKEALNQQKLPTHEKWPNQTFGKTSENGEQEVTCIAKGNPRTFGKNMVDCDVIPQSEIELTYDTHEEVVSHVVRLTPTSGDKTTLDEPIYVAIPYVMSRASAASREPVVKGEISGEWRDLPTRDVTFDSHKDVKFAEAEVHNLTTLIVMSRLKRDYVSLHKRTVQIKSSTDPRVMLTVNKDTFTEKEHFLMQVQPVDSASVADYRSRDPRGKGLMSSSPIVHTQWEATQFLQPISVTLPCPPNPARLKKLQQQRRLKEERMKNPQKQKMLEEAEKEREREREKERQREKKRQAVAAAAAAANEEAEEEKKVNKWYMGEYGHSEDDERELTYLLSCVHGRWSVVPDVSMTQPKSDTLAFSITFPSEKFVVVRTRTNVDEEAAVALVTGLIEYLSKRFVEVVAKQRGDDPFDVSLHITPVSRLDSTITQLAQEGFDEGPEPSQIITVREGDELEVTFTGNIKPTSQPGPLDLIFNSNVPTQTNFSVREVDKYRQKNYPVYKGHVVISRKYTETAKPGKRAEDGTELAPEVKREVLCDLLINIPKDHIEPDTPPIKAPIHVTTDGEPVNEQMLRAVAESLGDEWKKLAHHLSVHKTRVQAIMRDVSLGNRSEQEAKYIMLMTWLKRVPKAMDKVGALSTALERTGRGDLALQIQERANEYRSR